MKKLEKSSMNHEINTIYIVLEIFYYKLYKIN
jgi:hypothetical protein